MSFYGEAIYEKKKNNKKPSKRFSDEKMIEKMIKLASLLSSHARR